MTYLEKAEKFIYENEEVLTERENYARRCWILDFARWLDSQEKSEGKKKIEKLDINQSVGKDHIIYSYENRVKINKIIDFINAET